MTTPRDLADQFVASYRAAVFAKDVDAFMRLYEPDVRVFDTWGVWSYEGAPAWRKVVEHWFSSLGTERVQVTMDDVRVGGAPGLTLVSGIVTYAGVAADGTPLRAMQNRFTWAIVGDGDAASIAHEHTSAPIGFDDSTAILQRDKT